MEAIVQNIPMVISVVLPLVLVLMVITNIITEVLKGLMWQKLPTNILAFLVAMSVTILAFFAMCQITGIPITWYMVAGAVVLGFFVCFAAMYGFDKLRQTLEQINGCRKIGAGDFSVRLASKDNKIDKRYERIQKEKIS